MPGNCPHCGNIIQPHTKDPYSDLFLTFWASYPRRKGKGAAYKAWNKIKPTGFLFRRIMESLSAQKQDPNWLKDDGQFIPHPSTWLNQSRWEDDAITALPTQATMDAKKCRVCQGVNAAPGATVCEECAWCIKCDEAGKPSRLPPVAIVVDRNGMAMCFTCAGIAR